MRRMTLAVSLGGVVLLACPIWSAPRAEKTLKTVIKSYTLRGTLEQTIPKLETLGQWKIEVDWPALKATGVKKTDKVQLRGTNTKFIDIVDLMLAQVATRGKPLAWFAGKDDTLYLTTQTRVLRKRFGAKLPPGQTAPTRRVRGGKKTDTELRFEQARLEDVLETLRKTADVNLFVNWGALKNVGVTRDAPITIKARNISTARALDLVMLQLNGDKERMTSTYWVVDKGLVRVDTGEVLDTIMRTRVEDAADLLRITPNFKGKRMKTSPIGARPAENGKKGASEIDLFEEDDKNEEEETETPAELRARQKSELIEIIKNSIGPDMWHPNGKGTITIFRNQLVITQSLLGWKLMETGNR